MTATALPPLEDPAYVPEHPPVNGRVPADASLGMWSPQSQLRWFRRFMGQLKPMRHEEWARYFCNSTEHRGLCCDSCAEDAAEGYDYGFGDHCCCYAVKVD